MTNKLKKLKKIIKKPNVNVMFMALGLLLVTASLMLGGLREINSWHVKVQAGGIKSTQSVKNDKPLIMGSPTHISVPNVGIDLPVIPGSYNPQDKSWTLTLDNAQWGSMTSQPN